MLFRIIFNNQFRDIGARMNGFDTKYLLQKILLFCLFYSSRPWCVIALKNKIQQRVEQIFYKKQRKHRNCCTISLIISQSSNFTLVTDLTNTPNLTETRYANSEPSDLRTSRSLLAHWLCSVAMEMQMVKSLIIFAIQFETLTVSS